MLNLNLNYTHKNLSPGFRRMAMVLGCILLITGSCGFIFNHHSAFWPLLNSAINIFLGFAGFNYAMRRLPWFALKYIKITDDSIKFKLSMFTKRKRLNWDEIEQIEISSDNIKIWSELAEKPKSFSLRMVSYDDYQTFNKVVVDIAMQKDIDMI